MQAISLQKRHRAKLGADGFEKGWFGLGSTWFRGPYWIMTKNQHFLQALWNVGVPDKILTRVTAATGGATRLLAAIYLRLVPQEVF